MSLDLLNFKSDGNVYICGTHQNFAVPNGYNFFSEYSTDASYIRYVMYTTGPSFSDICNFTTSQVSALEMSSIRGAKRKKPKSGGFFLLVVFVVPTLSKDKSFRFPYSSRIAWSWR